MRIQFSKIALAAGVSLALAFTISCSSDDGDKGGDGGKTDDWGKHSGPGCLQLERHWCMESSLMSEAGCKPQGNKYSQEYKPQGCPDNWIQKCISSAGFPIYYYELTDEAEGDYKYSNEPNSLTTCTRK